MPQVQYTLCMRAHFALPKTLENVLRNFCGRVCHVAILRKLIPGKPGATAVQTSDVGPDDEEDDDLDILGMGESKTPEGQTDKGQTSDSDEDRPLAPQPSPTSMRSPSSEASMSSNRSRGKTLGRKFSLGSSGFQEESSHSGHKFGVKPIKRKTSGRPEKRKLPSPTTYVEQPHKFVYILFYKIKSAQFLICC